MAGGLCMWTWGWRCCLLWAPGNQAWDSSLLTHDEAPGQLQLQKIWGINCWWSVAAVSRACACSPANNHRFLILDDFFSPSVKMINFLQYYMCYSGSRVAQYVPWLTRGCKIVILSVDPSCPDSFSFNSYPRQLLWGSDRSMLFLAQCSPPLQLFPRVLSGA